MAMGSKVESLIAHLRPFALYEPKKKGTIVSAKRIEDVEKAGRTILPTLLREVLVQYGGLNFADRRTEIDYRSVLADVKAPQKTGLAWRADYIEIAREPDGSPYLIRRSNRKQNDTAVYRFGHDEGDEKPKKVSASLAKWFSSLAAPSKPNPRSDDQARIRTLELRLALGTARPNRVRSLIAAGADVNDRGNDGITALMKAALFHDLRILELLVEAGANPNDRDDDGRTPLDFCLTSSRGSPREHIAAAKYLVQRGAIATAKHNKAIAEFEIASGAS